MKDKITKLLEKYVDENKLTITVLEFKEKLDKEYEKKYAKKSTETDVAWLIRGILGASFLGMIGWIFSQIKDSIL